MTTDLAQHLAERLQATLPFLDRVTGLARVHERTIMDGDTPRSERLPVPAAYTAAECERDGRYLTPDEHTGSIVFFEDGGEISTGQGQATQREATLRLLLWLNPFKLSHALPQNRLQAEVEQALSVRRRFDTGDYRGLFITTSTLPAGAALLSAYSFGGGTTPLLYPPYQLLGLELKCRYQYAPACLLPALPTLDLDRTACLLPPASPIL
ncbi:hypothetical protein BEN47_06130 [Hymenobacter lapidarius]|uniref:Uncharacterized protein n=1 Tax=Hymenobacter lapidarius TaxID=1908237 RepID=A0A1G1SQD8_9BACT|nr:hypothetical protein [Hymenobacter lapidarius]OGX80832.1 hypothetical protein BEN47_06130 [Hymenobacter lapidarius]